MNLLFRTNPVLRPQDDYGWYRLEESGWTPCSPSGNSPDIPVAAAIPRGFSTIRVDGTCCVLLRDRGRLSLTIGVPTRRREVGPGGRPVGDVVHLQAETEDDERLLARLAAEAFSTEDAQGLGDPAHGLGAAVDAVWTSASIRPLAELSGRAADESDGESLPRGAWTYPRADLSERRAFSRRIAATVQSKAPFLLALTDRTPDEALRSLTDFRGDHWIFSRRVERAAKAEGRDAEPSFSQLFAEVEAVAKGWFTWILAVVLLVAALCVGYLLVRDRKTSGRPPSALRVPSAP